MSYIGQRPVVGRYIKLDQISSGFNGSNTGFSMTAGSQAVFPGTARNLLLSLGGVIQEPDTDFTISGSTLTFTTPPVANTTFFGVIYGDMQATGTPSDGTVLPASIASSGHFKIPQLTVNEDGADVDFRVEGDTEANLLFADASTNRIGIGTSSPATPLEVRTSSDTEIAAIRTGSIASKLGAFASGESRLTSAGNNGFWTFYTGTSSAERMRVDTTGKVGIGESASIDAKLHVNSGTDNATLFIESTDGDVNLCMADNAGSCRLLQSAGDLHFRTGGNANAFGTGDSERMVINSSGNVGIGVTSPGEKLDVAGTIQLTNFLKATGDLLLCADIDNNNSGSALRFCVDGDQSAEKMRIQDSGNVGIGTTGPSSLLHARTASVALGSNGHIYIQSTDAGADIGGQLNFGNSNARRCAIAGRQESSDAIAGYLQFGTRGTIGDITERMRIDSSGNVGIGTTSPHSISGYQGITLNHATHGGFVQFQDDGTNTSHVLGGASSLNLSTQTSIPIIFNTAGGEKMRIDSAGRVGIGTTNIGSHQLLVQGGKAETGGSSLALKTASDASGTLSALALYGTFVTPTADQGTRRTADIISGFATGNWGNEFLSFNVGKSGASNDTQQVCDERMRITGAGDLVLSSTSARIYNGHRPRLSVQGINFSQSTVAITNNSTGNDGAYLFFAKQKSGSVGGSTAVSDNTIVGQMRYLAGDGTDIESEVANITVSIDGTPGSNDTPGRITFATTNDGGSVSTERMRITQAGQILMGTTSNNSVNAKLAVSADGVPSYYANPAGLSVNTTNSNDAHCVEFFQGRYNKRVLTQSHSNTGTVTFEVFEQADVNVGIITGNGSTTNFNTNPSDRSLKKNFESWDENVLSLFKNINPQKFNYIQQNDGEEKSKGFIAQEMVDSFPEAYPLIENEDNKHYFNPSGMVVYLMKAIQELEAEVAALKSA